MKLKISRLPAYRCDRRQIDSDVIGNWTVELSRLLVFPVRLHLTLEEKFMIRPVPSDAEVRFAKDTVIPGLNREALIFSVNGFQFHVLKMSPVHLGQTFLPDGHYDRFGQALKES